MRKSRIFVLRLKLQNASSSLGKSGILLKHRPMHDLPLFNFSLSPNEWCLGEATENRGRLFEILRMCLWKKPRFWVEKVGNPLFPFPRDLDEESQFTGFDVAYAGAGLDRPLEFIVRPGVAQPPPGTGEGLLDRDIGWLGVPITVEEVEEADRLVY